MNEPYELLRQAILRQAVKDYTFALKKRNFAKIKQLERFFRSGWGELLSYGHGDFIIEKCKNTVENNRIF